MEDEEVVEINLAAEDFRQQQVQHAAGVLRREIIAGLKGDENDPDNRWPPGTPKRIFRTRRSQSALPLLDRIIGSFARDHHIMHVTLTKPRRTDAHELSLLLQLCDSLASAIAHA